MVCVCVVCVAIQMQMAEGLSSVVHVASSLSFGGITSVGTAVGLAVAIAIYDEMSRGEQM
jgi:hypothetical protein